MTAQLELEIADPGPSHDEGRASQKHPADIEVDNHTNTAHSAAAPQDLLSQLRRRHEAALRLPPLPHSGRRDPEGMSWWRR
jgi:hypothetical protein